MNRCGLQMMLTMEKMAARQLSRYFAIRAPVTPMRVWKRYCRTDGGRGIGCGFESFRLNMLFEVRH